MQSKTLLSLLAVTGAFLHGEMASGQALPPSVRTPQADKTLGTQVSGNGNNFNITGGLNRGQTLFHSFKDFSIPTGGAANFNNPAGTRDIITRVTGNLFSDLNGTLNSNGANFLLINPNGVVFGPNARLNVGKAFAASTASGVDLIDGQGRQITFGTKPGGDAPLLKINPNVFLNISRLNMGASVPKNPGIVNYGKLQTNNDSQYIGLIGGNVTLDGKYGGGKIIAPGGRIDLGGLNSAGTVSTDAQGLVFGGNGLVRGDVLLTNDALVTARANGTLGTVNPFFSSLAATGSNININANNLNVLNSGAKSKTGFAAIDNGLAENSGVKIQPAGNININATGLVNLDNAVIRNTLRSGAEGKIGDVKINANSLSLINQSIISSTTAGKGNAGDINVTTTGDISISGTTPQSTKPASLDKLSSINSTTDGRGDAGKITLDTQGRGKLLLSNQAVINNSIRKDAVGNSKGIEISARSVDLKNGGLITSDNDGQGDAGNISIKTIGDISLFGTNTPSTRPILQQDPKSLTVSTISSSTDGKGNAGKITIDTQNQGKVSLSNQASIFSTIDENGIGNGNDINISAREVDIRNGGVISSGNFGGKGDAGNINITTTGDISLSASNPQSTTPTTQISDISSDTTGQGNTGKITIDTQNRGKLSLDRSSISTTIDKKAVGSSNGIIISAREIELRNGSKILSANGGGKGDAGNIDLKTIGDISLSGSAPQSTAPTTQNSDLSGISAISSATLGRGSAGKITIDTQDRGKLSLDRSNIFTTISPEAVGSSNGIIISAREIALGNGSVISSANLGGKGDAGNIDLKTIGDISLSGSAITSNTSGRGNAGKITIDTQERGKLSLDRSGISTAIDPEAVGSNNGIIISAQEIALGNKSRIFSNNLGGKGDAGNIDLKTIGDISLSGSAISSSTDGQGNTGKITIDTQDKGKLSLDRSSILTAIGQKAVGSSNGIIISAREIALGNGSFINSANLGGKGDAGNIDLKTIGDISLSGSTPESTAPTTQNSDLSAITSSTLGQGNAGKITIDTQDRGKLSLDRSGISTAIGQEAVGNGGEIAILARKVDLRNGGLIFSSNLGGKGDAGNIIINTKGDLELTDRSLISSTSSGQGKTGDISLNIDRITLNNSTIEAQSFGGAGGNIQLTTSDRLLLRNSSNIATNSGSNEKNGDGGNITINSPLIIALPGNNDIAADAIGGNGGKVNITSQGLFGIKYRPKGQDSLFTSDITSSSTFGQSGTVNISTPGTDPGKDSTQLPNVPTDASNQIAQACGASRENKFIVAGRGGIPSNANDPLTSDVVWQDARGTNSQPTAISATTDPTKLAPPATGLVFDGKGKATLIAAGTQGQPTGTSVVCPSVVRK